MSYKHILLVVLVLCSSLGAVGQSKSMDFYENQLDEASRALIQKYTLDYPVNTQLAIAVLTNQDVSFFGLQRTKDSITIVNNQDKVFEIGSITKVFTATLLAQAVEEGKVKLEDTITKCSDFAIKDQQPITLLSLANHTSGLPKLPSNINPFEIDINNPYKNYSAEDLKVLMSKYIQLSSVPGTSYNYSNLGAGILGYLLTIIRGDSYENLLQKYIFNPYEMTQSSTLVPKKDSLVIQGLNAEGLPTPYWTFDVLVGAGGIRSSVNDLSKFAQRQFNDAEKALKLTQQATFTINKNMKIGLGWHIIENNFSDNLIWHNGGTGGFTSSMVLDLNQKKGVIILSNVSSAHPKKQNIDALAFELLKHELNQ